MSQTRIPPSTQSAASGLPGLPRMTLTPLQQLEALRRVQATAEQRVKLGTQLFKAAEAHTSQYRQALNQLKEQQLVFEGRLKQEQLDLQGVEAQLTPRIESLENSHAGMAADKDQTQAKLDDRLAALQDAWQKAQERLEWMLRRGEAMLEQSRRQLDDLGSYHASRPAADPPSQVAQQTPATQPVGSTVRFVPVQHCADCPLGPALDQIQPGRPDARLYRQIIERMRPPTGP